MYDTIGELGFDPCPKHDEMQCEVQKRKLDMLFVNCTLQTKMFYRQWH